MACTIFDEHASKCLRSDNNKELADERDDLEYAGQKHLEFYFPTDG